jgi:hypothetical protein
MLWTVPCRAPTSCARRTVLRREVQRAGQPRRQGRHRHDRSTRRRGPPRDDESSGRRAGSCSGDVEISAGGGEIVVGVDGSPSSSHALRWAVRQSGLTCAPVRAIIAWSIPVHYGPMVVSQVWSDWPEVARQTLEHR